MIAVACKARVNDAYYGQWLLLHVPFRSLDDLWWPMAERVPHGYRFLALCLWARPAFWNDDGKIRTDLELDGH
eukprot:3248761-Prorocentrum_lima.AAC.1